LFLRSTNDWELREGEEIRGTYDYSDRERLASQIRAETRATEARFIARFDDTGHENSRTVVGVLPLGAHPHCVEPDQTYLSLRKILGKKRDQLPKGSRGIIVLDLTDLEKLMVDQLTIESSVYGDLMVILREPHGGGDIQHGDTRRPNGFFLSTSRVSAVVVERVRIVHGSLSVNREVFPTNNPHAVVLALDELQAFGTIAQGLEHLCAEHLQK
jgi:hypothetical protein